MKILITGASGFIGRHLVRALLQRGHDLVLPLRRNTNFPLPNQTASGGKIYPIEVPDLTDTNYDRLCEDVEAIVHLAAISHARVHRATELYNKNNYKLPVDLGMAAVRNGVERFIFMSSIRAQTGLSSDYVLTEQNTPMPIDDYGRSKLSAERDLAQLHGLNVVSLRPVVVYGPEAKGNVGLMRQLMRWGIPLPIGDLKAKRSYLSIDRLISAIVFALEHPEPLVGAYVVADRKPLNLADFARCLYEAAPDIAGTFSSDKRPRIFSLPESLLKLVINGLNPDLWCRIGENQIATSQGLEKAGWQGFHL